MPRRLPLMSLLLLLAASLASARIISYAPYSDRISVPAMGHRLNRHFALVETRTPSTSTMWGQIVLYDSKGEEEPRVVFPQDNSEIGFTGVAMREPPGEPPMILAVTSAAWNLSVDGGKTWKKAQVAGSYVPNSPQVDLGGWYARGRYSNIRIGTREYPFVAVSLAANGWHLVAIGADGAAKDLLVTPSSQRISLAGSDDDRRRFLVRVGDEIDIVDLDGSKTYMSNVSGGSIEGWITDSGAAYVELYKAPNDISLWLLYGIATFIDGTYDKNNPVAVPPPSPSNTLNPFFAVPTNDYSGAWIVKRRTGQPTRLLNHVDRLQRGLVEQWSDITAPEVEAILPAPTSDKILIQVHRPRRGPDALVTFKDPALAVWRIGTPAPKFYDELYLNESSDKGFVHLDVDGLEKGEPFVFDGGRTITPGCGCGVSAGGGGGGEVVQEWGVVRGSTWQRLVLPGFGRTAGAFGSLWRSDVTFQNPNDVAVDVTLRFVAAGDAVTASATNTVRLQLAPRELRLVTDAAKELFHIEGGVGALFINPEGGASINATGRTYTQSANGAEGTYGYGMNAIDVYAASSARFPVTFSGAFQGPSFRTNLFLTDVSGRGVAAAFSANGPNGALSIASVPAETSPFGVLQRNNLSYLLGLSSQAIGALAVTPTRGEAVVSLFTVDNRTNDPTFFPPDLSVGMVRTIPVVGHLEGANGSQFRSDLFLYNQSSFWKSVTIEMRSWTSSDFATLSLWLGPLEARMFPDVLKTSFNRSGTARLRIAVQGTTLDPSVRVTSRTYTVDASGGTYGFLMPPLNSFQSATTGDTLEILGTALDHRFRTNIGLVDVTASFSATPRARIEIVGANGATRDSFETAIPSLGGLQLNDLFRARALPDDGTPVLIRITPLQGMIGAYAAMLDNDTNDSTYFAANLAAK